MAEAFDPDKYLQEKVKVPQNSIPFDPDKYLQEKNLAPLNQSFGEKIQDAISELSKGPTRAPGELFQNGSFERGLVGGLNKIDEFTGAPIRKKLTEVISGKTLDHAPSGSEQAAMMGVPTQSFKERYGVPSYLGGDVTPSGVAGIGLEVLQDPLLIGSGLVKGVKALRPLVGGVGEELKSSAGLLSKQGVTGIQDAEAMARSEGAAKSSASFSGGDSTIENSGQLLSIKQPKTLEDLRNWEPKSGVGEMQSSKRLGQIEVDLPDLQTKPLPYHYEMLSNPKKMKELKLQFENLPNKDAQKIAIYNKSIVDEAAEKATKEIRNISGSEPMKIADAGHDFIDTVKNKYNTEKSTLGPMFQKFKETSQPLSKNQALDMQIAIGENSKIGSLMKVNHESGAIEFMPNSPKTGLSPQEYNTIKDVLGDFNGKLSFKDIQNIREHMRKTIDYANPHATEEIGKVRSILLDQLENMASASNPEMRETFKQYAVNERMRESIEKVIGGKVESMDTMFSANPDNVVKKIFSNPNHADLVKQYIGPEKFNGMVQSYINKGLESSIDSVRGFEPSKLRNFLNKNQVFLERYVRPEISKRLTAAADYGYMGKRFLDEVNPSGTAASLIAALEPGNFAQKITSKGLVGAITSEATGLVNSKIKQKQAIDAFNEAMGNLSMSQTKAGKRQLRNDFMKGSVNTSSGIRATKGLLDQQDERRP